MEYSLEDGTHGTSKLVIDKKGIRVEPASPGPKHPGYFLGARIAPTLEEDAKNLGQIEVEKEPYDLVEVLRIVEPRLTRLRTISSAGGTMIYGDIGLEKML